MLHKEAVEIRLFNIVGSPGDKSVELLSVFTAGNRSPGNLGQSQFPARGQPGIQQGLQSAAAGIKDHLSRPGGCDDLCFFIQTQIVVVKQFFQDLCPRGAGPDPAAPDLLSQLLLFDQLARIFHGQDHAPGGIALWRSCLSFTDREGPRQYFGPFSGCFQKSGQGRIRLVCNGLLSGRSCICSVLPAVFSCRSSAGNVRRAVFCTCSRYTCPGLRILFFEKRIVQGIEVASLHAGAQGGIKELRPDPDRDRDPVIDRRRVKDGNKAPYDQFIDVLIPFGEGRQCLQAFAGRYDGVVVSDRLVIRISRLSDLFPGPALQDRDQQAAVDRDRRNTLQIFADLLCHSRTQDAGVRPRIGSELFFIELLGRGERLVRADLKKAGAVVLQFSQIIQERRILFFLLSLDLFNNSGNLEAFCFSQEGGIDRSVFLRDGCREFLKDFPVCPSCQIEDQPLCIFSF